MPAANYNITVEQGADFRLPLQLLQSNGVTPVNITGYTFASKIRLSASNPTVLATITIAITNALLGEFLLSMTNAETAAILTEPSGGAIRKITQAAWDLEMTSSGGLKYRVLQGIAKISPEVTS